MTWQNRGVAPAYNPYQLIFQVKGPETRTVTVDARNITWMPGKPAPVYREVYTLPKLAKLPADTYELSMRMHCPATQRPVLLPFKQERRSANGFYTIGSFSIP